MLTEKEIQINREYFNELALQTILRKGNAEFLSWLSDTDFFHAPASSKYHGNYDGGLCEHSLAVYRNLRNMIDKLDPYFASDESIALVSLYHDACKINLYEKYLRYVKNDKTGEWEQVECYKIFDPMSFGAHGAKSMYMVMHFMNLSVTEATAILHHMGAWDKSDYTNPGNVYEWNRLAWYLHLADEAATYGDKK